MSVRAPKVWSGVDLRQPPEAFPEVLVDWSAQTGDEVIRTGLYALKASMFRVELVGRRAPVSWSSSVIQLVVAAIVMAMGRH